MEYGFLVIIEDSISGVYTNIDKMYDDLAPHISGAKLDNVAKAGKDTIIKRLNESSAVRFYIACKIRPHVILYRVRINNLITTKE